MKTPPRQPSGPATTPDESDAGLPELALADPKGLMRESYRIDGITESECRSIFLDWALSLGAHTDPKAAIRRLRAEYGDQQGHPMTAILNEGLAKAPQVRRRGGRDGRLGRG